MLNHPHICSVYETTEHEGRLCIVMERLEGVTLKQHLLKRPLETSEILDIAMQIIDALEAAHNVGIVHRDVKPGNIFIGENGFVKLLDFGLARRFQVDDEDEVSLHGSSIPGRPVGTPNYMAPERILQMPVDPRTDLFSLGVVIYEMATERLPFGASSPADTALNILENSPTPLRQLSPERPAKLERIVHKLLAKQPDQRYQSAAELRGALFGLLSVKRAPFPEDRRRVRTPQGTRTARRRFREHSV
jgi:serine/threonine-protein kinase